MERDTLLNAIIFHEDGGVSSHWHGWSDKWLFTHKEAIAKKEEIKGLFDEVEILEHESEQEEIREHIKIAMKESE